MPVSAAGTDYNPFRFGGQYGGYTDSPVGIDCVPVLFGARWYEPYIGRWMSQDPIEYSGGDNLYAYCYGDPINYADPSGLYGGDVHYDRTRRWLIRIGVDPAVASRIAYYDNYTDADPNTAHSFGHPEYHLADWKITAAAALIPGGIGLAIKGTCPSAFDRRYGVIENEFGAAKGCVGRRDAEGFLRHLGRILHVRQDIHGHGGTGLHNGLPGMDEAPRVGSVGDQELFSQLKDIINRAYALNPNLVWRWLRPSKRR